MQSRNQYAQITLGKGKGEAEKGVLSRLPIRREVIQGSPFPSVDQDGCHHKWGYLKVLGSLLNTLISGLRASEKGPQLVVRAEELLRKGPLEFLALGPDIRCRQQ